MIGGIYCPLSPRDPEHRLYALMKQTESRLVLVHWLTQTKFNDDIISFDIASLLINKSITKDDDDDIDLLSNVIITSNNVAYIIFTSGSTGTPKAVCFSPPLSMHMYKKFCPR